MSHYEDDFTPTPVVGSFMQDKFVDFKENLKCMLENFRSAYSLDGINDITQILRNDVVKEDYKSQLMEDVLNESYQDPYLDMSASKIEQLFENSAYEILRESHSGQLAPVVGLSLPILKKNYLECHAKDIVMTEVPTKPIIRVAFERKFLKDKKGNKYYIPEIFYDQRHTEIMDLAKGKPITDEWYPTSGTLPVQDLNVLELSGGTLETRDALGYDFCIDAVKIKTTSSLDAEEIKTVQGLQIKPDMTYGSFTYRVKATGGNGVVVEDILTGQVDFYSGQVSVASTAGLITQVQFAGHLSNRNNINTLEVDRERTVKDWNIPEGVYLNTGLTTDRIKDTNVLFDIDLTSETISDMATTLTHDEDGRVLKFLDESLDRWRGRKDLPFGYEEGFTETYEFSATPTSQVLVTQSNYIASELKFNLERMVDTLKEKLKTSDIMFVAYGNPAVITLLQDGVRWVVSEDTKIGGIQLDYRFGVMTSIKDRIHVVSSMKVPRSKGIRLVAYPLSKETITFKHYKYSLTIENTYRNPNTPLTPNIMATSRYLTTELLPVQGEYLITNMDFGRKPQS